MKGEDGFFLVLLSSLALYNAIVWHSDRLTEFSLAEAYRICEPNKGVEYVEPDNLHEFNVRCNNGAIFVVEFQYARKDHD